MALTASAGSRGAGLSRRQALPLAVGSVAGSGILFLPSAVYASVGRDSLWVWLVATALCLPMLLLFEDVVRSAPPGRGMEWLIGRGLGRPLGRCVPVLFVAVVALGLPGGALVAGAYARQALGAGATVSVAVATAVLLVAVAVNLGGVRASARAQTLSTWLMVAVVTGLAAFAMGRHGDLALRNVLPTGWHPGPVLAAVVLAFWAFAGFENLTFLSGELRRPHRDLLPVSAAALVLYGGLTVVLTAAIAANIPRRAVQPLTGLLQLADGAPLAGVVVAAVLATALLAMVMNAVAWTWGVSRLVTRASGDGLLPGFLAVTSAAGTPVRTLLVMALLYTPATSVLAAWPALVPRAIAAASSVFVVLYGLCILAYLRVRGVRLRSVLNLLPLTVIAVTLGQAGWQSLYAVVVAAVYLGLDALTRRRGATVADEEAAPCG